ncbi:MAG: DUF6105 family protein [Allorhizobium sp.]
MKWFLVLWAFPIILLGSWYGLSYNDISFGIFMLTREANDLVFQIYGNVLGIPPEIIPGLVARAIVVDSLAVFAIMGFRRRRMIAAWWGRRQSSKDTSDGRSARSFASADNLSKAP